MKHIKLFEDYTSNPFNPHNYIYDYYATDFYEIYEDDVKNNPELIDKVISDIQIEIDYVKNIKYPIEIWRALPLDDNSNKYPYHEDDSGCWTTNRDIATGFGNKIFHGLIESSDNVDLEQTIRTRILNSGEKEFNVKDSTKVKILNINNI